MLTASQAPNFVVPTRYGRSELNIRVTPASALTLRGSWTKESNLHGRFDGITRTRRRTGRRTAGQPGDCRADRPASGDPLDRASRLPAPGHGRAGAGQRRVRAPHLDACREPGQGPRGPAGRA